MNKYDIIHNSLQKNIQELSEFLVDEFGITNYYDLVDLMIELFNFKLITKNEYNDTYNKVMKHLKEVLENE
ncbi:MAG: hypothetical protein IKU37_01520 [Candidatus Gastranaerophilales bacterium]|nr:hypothetical protein [Candidatus Gastranaerophilales bacterium]